MTQDELDLRFAQLHTDLKSEIRTAIAEAYRESIRAAIESDREHTRATVRELINELHGPCPLECIQRGDVRHLVGVIKDLGEGDIPRGIRRVRDNHIWVQKFSSTSNKLASTALMAGLAVIVTTFVTAMGVAIKVMIGATGQ